MLQNVYSKHILIRVTSYMIQIFQSEVNTKLPTALLTTSVFREVYQQATYCPNEGLISFLHKYCGAPEQ
jgi:hypothetical protein